MEALKEYVQNVLVDNKSLKDFAEKYYGIELDARRKRASMESDFFEQIKDIEPKEPLPFEELLLEEEPPVTPSVTLEEKTDIITEDEHKSLSEVISGYEYASKLPTFELNFKLGADMFTVVSFKVTDALDKVVRKEKTLEQVSNELENGHRKVFFNLLWYINQNGKVLVRETRNSKFITYKKEVF